MDGIHCLRGEKKMRCDNCPLCPIAEDDVCPEIEGKYGIEHADYFADDEEE